ncbi:MAG: MATE family efflux transporter [Mediterranea sp.]|nr:MATE family efflux transporter [Mediterranea sp.]
MVSSNNPHNIGTEPVGKLLLQYSIPAITGMTIVSLYHIIDSIFIGHGVGVMAISGLAITFPLMNLLMAFCTLISSGASTVSSIRLGQKDPEGATNVLGNAFILCIVNSVLVSIIFYIFLDTILLFFGASQTTLPYARDFMQVILIGTPISHVMIGLNNIMRATGYPKKAMLTSMVSVVSNLILAPIFIFYCQWGIGGAATATVLSQLIAMVWVVHHFMQKDSFVHFTRKGWKIRRSILGSICAIGMSPFLMNVCACAVVIVINNSLQTHGGDLAIGAYGIINRLFTFFFMILLGLTMGMQPIVGYNYGALKMQRVRQTLKLGIITGVIITAVGTLFMEVFPRTISGFFTDNDELIAIASRGLRICALMLPTVGWGVVISNFFQSIGKARISIFLSLCRQLFYFLPCLLILPAYFGQNGIWAAIPISDFLAFITTTICLLVYIRKLDPVEC